MKEYFTEKGFIEWKFIQTYRNNIKVTVFFYWLYYFVPDIKIKNNTKVQTLLSYHK